MSETEGKTQQIEDHRYIWLARVSKQTRALIGCSVGAVCTLLLLVLCYHLKQRQERAKARKRFLRRLSISFQGRHSAAISARHRESICSTKPLLPDKKQEAVTKKDAGP